eukprot:c2774_g1_i1.p1 GENE.c2774_g1_i1~~c2774_g1_i1.p1  ORF type:complete len:153 (-),score=14.84 c2774_g1_i1:252-677(-)
MSGGEKRKGKYARVDSDSDDPLSDLEVPAVVQEEPRLIVSLPQVLVHERFSGPSTGCCGLSERKTFIWIAIFLFAWWVALVLLSQSVHHAKNDTTNFDRVLTWLNITTTERGEAQQIWSKNHSVAEVVEYIRTWRQQSGST